MRINKYSIYSHKNKPIGVDVTPGYCQEPDFQWGLQQWTQLEPLLFCSIFYAWSYKSSFRQGCVRTELHYTSRRVSCCSTLYVFIYICISTVSLLAAVLSRWVTLFVCEHVHLFLHAPVLFSIWLWLYEYVWPWTSVCGLQQLFIPSSRLW